MALTQAEWYEKLRGIIPSWFFEKEEYNHAVFMGLAKVFEALDASADGHLLQTFICDAENGYLNEHGLERNILRNVGELDPSLAQRIKNITNTTNCPTLKDIVDALLEVGQSTIVEDYDAQVFFNREVFYSRGNLLIDQIYNTFSIIVDNQVHEPYSFFDRENFMDREDFIGRQFSSLELFEVIVEAVNRSKALGTLYRLVERVN